MFLRAAADSLNVDAPKGVVIGSSLPVSLSNSGAPFLFVIWADFTPFELHKMSPISISLNCVVVMAVLLHQRSCRPPDERTPTEAWGHFLSHVSVELDENHQMMFISVELVRGMKTTKWFASLSNT